MLISFAFIYADSEENVSFNYSLHQDEPNNNILIAHNLSVNEANETSATTRKRRRSRYIPPKKMKYSSKFDILIDTTLADGLIYQKIKWGGKYKHTFHLLELDLSQKDIYIKALKAHNLNTHLEKLQNIVKEFDIRYFDSVLAAVNANFWHAYSNFPIGPTIIDGELVEMHSYKKWSSGFFTADSKLYIDTFKISGIVSQQNATRRIEYVNRRRDSLGIVLYNQFAGDVIPFISSLTISDEIKSAIDQTVAELEFADSTDFEMDSVSLVQEIITAKQMANMEFAFFKAACRFLSAPAVNKETRAVVESIEKGIAPMPLNGFLLSFGAGARLDTLPKIGDTLIVKFSSNLHNDILFFNGVSGTPRLVRNGKAKNEARAEGSSSRRFINMQLPRTAIGTNKEKTKVYFVVVESSARSQRKVGASLYNLSKIMAAVGAYDAMNLDGGGSSIMVVGGNNILLPSKPQISRRISVGLGIILNK